jgi:hypothetical protein
MGKHRLPLCITVFTISIVFSCQTSPLEKTEAGERLIDTGRNREATDVLNTVFATEPRNSYALYLCGYTKGPLGDYQGVIQDCSLAIDANSDFALADKNRAWVQSKLRDFTRVI